jgi:hypothetical protein
MRVVYKYPLRDDTAVFADWYTVEMPTGAQVLTVQLQRGEPMLWALVDPREKKTVGRRFRLAGTGQPLGEDPKGGVSGAVRYVATFQLLGGEIVLHLFEEVAL